MYVCRYYMISVMSRTDRNIACPLPSRSIPCTRLSLKSMFMYEFIYIYINMYSRSYNPFEIISKGTRVNDRCSSRGGSGGVSTRVFRNIMINLCRLFCMYIFIHITYRHIRTYTYICIMTAHAVYTYTTVIRDGGNRTRHHEK